MIGVNHKVNKRKRFITERPSSKAKFRAGEVTMNARLIDVIVVIIFFKSTKFVFVLQQKSKAMLCLVCVNYVFQKRNELLL